MLLSSVLSLFLPGRSLGLKSLYVLNALFLSVPMVIILLKPVNLLCINYNEVHETKMTVVFSEWDLYFGPIVRIHRFTAERVNMF